MNEQIKSFEIYSPKIKLPKKGIMTIELTDVGTGHKQKFEDENMMTNAIEKYFANAGLLNYFYDDAVTRDMVPYFIGGILLFNDTLDEDPDKFTIPEARMVANGRTGYVNNSNPTELGSYSTNESGYIDGNYVLTFDYTTTQGNGTIKSGALTNNMMAFIGTGNPSGGRKSDQSYTFEGSDWNGVAYNWCPEGNKLIYKIDSDGYLYKVNNAFGTTGQLSISKCESTLHEINIRDRFKTLQTFSNLGSISLPGKTSYDNACIFCNNGKAYIARHSESGTWTTSNPLIIDEFDETGIVRYTINPPENITLYCSPRYIGCYIYNGYVYIPKYTTSYYTTDGKTAYKIKLSDGTLDSILTFPYGFQSAWETGSSKFKADEGVYYVNGAILNLKNETIYPSNQYTTYGFDSNANYTVLQEGNPLFRYVFPAGNTTAHYHLYRSRAFLVSINNLETPVTKTSDKTMKVTYRVSF